MDQNNGLEARISKEETKTKLTIDLREIPPRATEILSKAKLSFTACILDGIDGFVQVSLKTQNSSA